jgi:rare lipoprotein A
MVVVLSFVFLMSGCGSWLPWRDNGPGLASWYGNEYHGRRTASGEIFDEEAMTAAHRELPFGAIVQVTNLTNGKSVRVRINDRGPFVRGRVIDLSKGAARKIGMLNDGVVPVRLDVL